jgi:hypothetical protein
VLHEEGLATTTVTHTPPAAATGRTTDRGLGRTLVGGFYLVMGGINLGMSIADPYIYQHFADGGLFSFVRYGWQDIVMAHPVAWAQLLAAGEITFGALLLAGGRAARLGWACVIGFHVLLLLFGWGVWAYAVPALALLVWLARRDLRGRTGQRTRRS